MSSNIFKRFATVLAAFTLAITFTASAFAGAEIVPNELIVKFKEAATDAQISDALKMGRLTVRKHTQTQAMKARGHNGVTLTETGLSVDAAIAKLKSHPAVDYAEPNYAYKHQLVSNDPYVTGNYTWGLYGSLSTPANTYGSGAAVAWGQGFTGSSTVYVAVIDEGIDYAHPELSPNIWTNPSDPVDGIDNDGNGYVDDVHGWNFFGNNNGIFDTKPNRDQHGTHVSGTIGAKGGNGSGVAGVNWNVQIISGKFLGPRGGSTLDAAEAIDYFVDLKSRQSINLVAINASWGGGSYSQTLHDSIIRAAKAGILFCAAASNDGLNNDVTPAYPSNIDSSKGTSTETAASYNNVIAVAAIDSTGALASWSNYGAKTVHIGAPGVQILSCLPNSQLGYMSGTSMATPHVTGAVALYASTHPGASAAVVRQAIISAATATPSLVGFSTTGARLNVSQVIAPLAAPSGLVATAGDASVQLTWTAVNGATSYIVKRSATAGGPYTGIATVTGATHTDTSVSNGSTYFYVVAAVSPAETSPNSTEFSATPRPLIVPPTEVIASSAQTLVSGAATVTVGWTPVSGAASYRVKRATTLGGAWTTVGWVIGTSFSQAVTANNNQVYFYSVAAVTPSNVVSADSSTVTVPTVPASPINLVAKVVSTSEVQLTWTDRSGDELGFKVEYWNGAAWTQIATSGAGVNTLNLTGLTRGANYYFRVRAYDSLYNTPYSNTASVWVP
ncbi:MAG TPA: S8 family serine peptidase [Verrucomicrobiae bacterium]|nr:S8 family serine peptidase [Verrucomicrobiae bacterium]